MGTRVLYPSTFLNGGSLRYSSIFIIKVLGLVLEYLKLVLVPNTGRK